MGPDFSESGGRVSAFFVRPTSLLLTVGLALFAVLAPSASASPKQIVNQIGSPEVGEGGGEFDVPAGIAVNQTGAGGVPKGTVYVIDITEGKGRIQRFDPSGAFVSAWGFGVKVGNQEYEICTQAQECRSEQASFTPGVAGTFTNPRGIAVDQASGKVYVSADAERQGEARVDVLSAKGDFEGAFGTGVTGSGNAFQFCTMQTGCKRSFSGKTAKGGDFSRGVGGLSVDAAGDVYVANRGLRRVDVFEPVLTGGTVTGVEFLRSFGWGVKAGNPEFEVCTVSTECKAGLAGSGLGQFAEGSPSDVAVDSEGHVFALDAGNKRVQELSSTPAPLDASFGSTALEALFGPSPQLLNLAADPSATPNHLLVSGTRPGSEGRVAIAELDGAGTNALGAGEVHGEELPITTANGLAVAKASVGGSLYLSSATIGVLHGVFVLNELPTVEDVTDITGTSATFKGKVVSNGIDVSWHFEYSTDGKTWTRVPAADVDAGTAPETIAVEQQVHGLTGSQLYRVRLVQSRPLGGVATSEEFTFTTLAERPAILGTVAFPVKDTSATFNAYLDPQNEATSYRFEYGPADCAANPCTALPPSQASGGGLRLITQTATGLQPGTLYHYRLLATNATGTTAGPDRAFETFAAGRRLPDDRAYELVTPPDTGAGVPAGRVWGENDGRDCFDMFPASADGNSVVFGVKGASLPGLVGNGFFDLYESVRGPNGWSTVSKSASGSQSTAQGGGLCSSPDHLYSTLGTAAAPGGQGSLVVEGKQSNYIRVPTGVVDAACSPEPGGLFELVGCGSLGTDPQANARLLTAKATHLVFTSKVQLEPDAPPSGTEAVYDRSPGGPTHVVSLLPGGATPGADAQYQGASPDGATVAYKVAGTMYVRTGEEEAQEVAASPNTFAGISSDGHSVFYVNDASGSSPAGLFVYDTVSEAATPIASNSIFVNVSEDGSHVYFVSKSLLTGAEQNGRGQAAVAGENNLYVWVRASDAVHFVAVVDPRDVSGPVEDSFLTRWTSEAVTPNQTTSHGRGKDSSRTTPDGSALVFESRADLTGYDSGGHVEIYRYDAGSAALDCVSCPPDGIAAGGDARLQAHQGFPLFPVNDIDHLQNVTDDGQKVFFQTEDALVPGDLNGTWDVYEWKAGQQAYLISSGHGQLPSYLYAMTPSGSDAFFASAERLVPQDLSTVISIYDARVGGGFPLAESQPPCQGDNCQGTPSAAPQLPGAGSASLQGSGNEAPKPHCRKNQRRVKHKGKVRCVKRHASRNRHHHRRANRNRRAAR